MDVLVTIRREAVDGAIKITGGSVTLTVSVYDRVGPQGRPRAAGSLVRGDGHIPRAHAAGWARGDPRAARGLGDREPRRRRRHLRDPALGARRASVEGPPRRAPARDYATIGSNLTAALVELAAPLGALLAEQVESGGAPRRAGAASVSRS